jgi:hypothetical protein
VLNGEDVTANFDMDIPVPVQNALGYRKLYVLEQWLRRIAYTAILVRSARSVLGGMPDALVRELKRRRASLPARLHLGAETADEAVWMTTLEELRDLLTDEHLYPVVRRLTGWYHREMLVAKLDEIREIRNIIGHSRAVSARTLGILEGDLLALQQGVDTFRERVVGRTAATDDVSDEPGRQVVEYLDRQLTEASQAVSTRSLAVAQSEHFFHASVVPTFLSDKPSSGGEELGQWVDVANLIEALEGVRERLLAVVIPVRGESFTQVWPRGLTLEEHLELIDAWMAAAPEVWCDEPYVYQDERAICHPKVWFSSISGRRFSRGPGLSGL